MRSSACHIMKKSRAWIGRGPHLVARYVASRKLVKSAWSGTGPSNIRSVYLTTGGTTVMTIKGSKRLGPQMCDCCGREIVVCRRERDSRQSVDWDCPYCGFSNKQGVERMTHAARTASAKAAKKQKE